MTQQEQAQKASELPPADFSSLIVSIAGTTLIKIGLKDQKQRDLPLARWNIDLLSALKDKTKNNLNPEEEKLLNAYINDLRIQFINAQNEEKSKGESK